MAKMRVDLAGLLFNASTELRRTWPVGAFGLSEAAAHIEQVRGGLATLAEFCDLYMLPAPPDAAELTEAALTLRRERDELLAALQQIVDIDCEYCEGCKSAAIGKAIRIAAAALAKHRGDAS